MHKEKNICWNRNIKNQREEDKNTIDCLEKSKPDLLDLYTNENRDIIKIIW